MRQRFLVSAAIIAVLVVGLALGALAFGAQQAVLKATGSTPPSRCTPQPCLDLQGYTLWVTKVQVGGPVVRVTVRFRNASNSTHADPSDLRLLTADGESYPARQDLAGCTHWGRTEFANGATFGPVTVCFRPPSTRPPLKLDWNPDMGLLCCEATLRLT